MCLLVHSVRIMDIHTYATAKTDIKGKKRKKKNQYWSACNPLSTSTTFPHLPPTPQLLRTIKKPNKKQLMRCKQYTSDEELRLFTDHCKDVHHEDEAWPQGKVWYAPVCGERLLHRLH